MTVEFTDAVREDIRLLILLAGGTGAGKTESAMRLATGLAAGQPFAVIDTENGRALHKADDYSFKHASLAEPFTPERYTEAIEAAADFPVIVVDSGSHEYDGQGGVLDIQADEFKRMGEREGARMASWIEPKRRHKRFVQTLLRSPAHVILCLRAEDKIEIVKDDQGKTVVRPKETLTGTKGWVPIVEKRLPFEATISLLLLQENPGVPVPIKLERRHADLIPLDRPLDEKVGEALAAWAKGSGAAAGNPSSAGESATDKPGASAPPPTSGDVDPSGAPGTLTDEQRDRLDELQRDYSLAQLIATFAKDRGLDVDQVLVDDWPALREKLSEAQAESWIERMSAKVGATA